MPKRTPIYFLKECILLRAHKFMLTQIKCVDFLWNHCIHFSTPIMKVNYEERWTTARDFYLLNRFLKLYFIFISFLNWRILYCCVGTMDEIVWLRI